MKSLLMKTLNIALVMPRDLKLLTLNHFHYLIINPSIFGYIL